MKLNPKRRPGAASSADARGESTEVQRKPALGV